MKNYSPEQLQEILNNCSSKADFCRALEIAPKGGNYETIDKLIKKYDLNANFEYKPWNKGKKYAFKKYSLEEILVENSPHRGTFSLRERLIRAGIKKSECEICGYSDKIELHHINGNPYDNRLENLQILCPNCHAKTDNYRIKNSSIVKRQVQNPNDLFLTEEQAKQRELEHKARRCGKTVEEYLENKKLKQEKLENRKKICPICGKEFMAKNAEVKYCSVECYKLDTKGNRPSLPQLINDFKELKSFVQVGNKYGVSDNAVRKWCKLYQIPFHTSELKEYVANFNNPDYVPIKSVVTERKQLNHQQIIDDYNSGLIISEVAKNNNCDPASVRQILNKNGIKLKFSKQQIRQIENGIEIQIFDSTTKAAQWIIDNNISSFKIDSIVRNIRKCCRGEKNSAYNYTWKYKD